MQAVGADEELEADVFEELDSRHRLQVAEDRAAPPGGGAGAPRGRPALAPPQRRTVGALLGCDPAEAGGLMSPDFVSVYRQATAGEALERVRRSRLPDEILATVWVMDQRHRFLGAVALATLVRADPEAAVVDLDVAGVPSLRPDADFEEIARLMADYNLIAAAVVDEEERRIGVVTVDDVLGLRLPKRWG